MWRMLKLALKLTFGILVLLWIIKLLKNGTRTKYN